jgi:hypothetical protein
VNLDRLRRADRADWGRRLARRQGLALVGPDDGPFSVVDPRRGTTLAEGLSPHAAQRALEARLAAVQPREAG